MSETIDRIARAMRDHPDTTNQLIQGEAEHLARVVIVAMRTVPDEYFSILVRRFNMRDDAAHREVARGWYTDMIDAALEKQPA